MSEQKKVVSLTESELLKLMYEESHNRFMMVRFIKRSTGQPRDMICRVGVKKHLAGGPPAYDFNEKRLVSVWEPGSKGGYKAIPLEGIVKVTLDGVDYVNTGFNGPGD